MIIFFGLLNENFADWIEVGWFQQDFFLSLFDSNCHRIAYMYYKKKDSLENRQATTTTTTTNERLGLLILLNYSSKKLSRSLDWAYNSTLHTTMRYIMISIFDRLDSSSLISSHEFFILCLPQKLLQLLERPSRWVYEHLIFFVTLFDFIHKFQFEPGLINMKMRKNNFFSFTRIVTEFFFYFWDYPIDSNQYNFRFCI